MDTTDDVVRILLKRRAEHEIARLALGVLQDHPNLFHEFVREARWLKRKGRPGNAESLTRYLRERVGKVAQSITPLFARLAVILHRPLNDVGLFKMRSSEADAVFGTKRVTRRGKKKGTWLRVSKSLRLELAALPPLVLLPDKEARVSPRPKVTIEQTAWVLPYVDELIAGCPNPQDPSLVELREHAAANAEVIFLAERQLRKKARRKCSIPSCLAYGLQAAKKIGRRFTLNNNLRGFYTRILARRNPRFDGWVKFLPDGTGAQRESRVNEILGTYLADKRVGRERYPRLHWVRDNNKP